METNERGEQFNQSTEATNVRQHQHVIDTLHLLVAYRSGFSVETLLLHPATELATCRRGAELALAEMWLQYQFWPHTRTVLLRKVHNDLNWSE